MEKGSESKEVLGLTISEIRGMSDEQLREQMSARMPKIKKWIEEGQIPLAEGLSQEGEQ